MVAIVRRAPVQAKKLRRLYDAAAKDRNVEKFNRDLQEGFEKGHIKAADFSVRDLFEHFVPDGREVLDHWRQERRSGGVLLEASAVNSSMFTAINGQVMYNAVLEAYQDPQFIGDQLVTFRDTDLLDGEKIAGIAGLGDVVEAIGENHPYPHAGVSPKYIETPKTTKRGVIVPVTKEAVIADRTGELLRQAGDVGRAMGLNREKRILDTVLGITTSYKRNGGAAQATYGDTHTGGTFDNLAASNALVDYTDVENALLLFDGMTDPDTGEAISVMPNTIIVPTALKMTANAVLTATAVERVDNTAAASTFRTMAANPLAGQGMRILSSPLVSSRTSSSTTWFVGDPQRAFAYMRVWDITVVTAPTNNEAEFTHDIVARYKVSEMGVPAVVEPRLMVKNTA